MVTKISIVGVDDSVCPQDLVDISSTYPFVEWGVNLCPEPVQRPEHPSAEWLEELLQYSEHLRLRGILHGRWENDILEGTHDLHLERPDIWNKFRWLQVDVKQDTKTILKSLEQHPDKIILQTKLTHLFKYNILLPRSEIFKSENYCGYSIFDSDVELLCKRTNIHFWFSVEGFRNSENYITMDLNKVYNFLKKVESFITHRKQY